MLFSGEDLDIETDEEVFTLLFYILNHRNTLYNVIIHKSVMMI